MENVAIKGRGGNDVQNKTIYVVLNQPLVTRIARTGLNEAA